MPRETLPRLTAQEAARYLRGAADRLGLEFTESAGVAPVFLLLPAGGAAPDVTLFQTWHAEAAPVAPAAVEGAERLALGAAVAGASVREGRVALVVAPAASAGSRGLDETLRAHRERLAGKAAYWIRVVEPAAGTRAADPAAGTRRNVFLGARGRVVIALRGGDANPYRARDTVVQELRDGAYGPRPLDFELIRKLASRPEVATWIGDERRLQAAMFEPRGEIVIPAVAHPDRPRAWLTFETAEAMEAEPIAVRVQALSGGGSAEVVENFPWDRANIHHPAIHALIALARQVSGGAEIWPSAPWSSPSGVFSRALGVGLSEWGLPLPAGAQVRFPRPEEFGALAREASALLVSAAAEPS